MTQRRPRLCLAGIGLLLGIAGCSVTGQPKADPRNMLVTHDVRDLILPVAGKPAHLQRDAMLGNIKAATGPDYWDGDTGASISWVDDGYLLVKANSIWQEKVTMLLMDMDDHFATGVHRKIPPFIKKK